MALESLTIVRKIYPDDPFALRPAAEEEVLTNVQMDALGVLSSSWAQKCMLEGNKLWLYSLICSILLGGRDLWYLSELLKGAHYNGVKAESGSGEDRKMKRKTNTKKKSKIGREKEEQKRPPGEPRSSMRRKIMAKIVVDALDLCLPGHVTGWLPTSLLVVGCASVMSTLLSSGDVWDRLR